MLSDRDEVDRRLSAAADELRRQGIGVTAHLLGGDAADAVIDVAEATEAALIVIDPRAASGHARGARTRCPPACARARRATCCSRGTAA